jgi:hypothetical protein
MLLVGIFVKKAEQENESLARKVRFPPELLRCAELGVRSCAMPCSYALKAGPGVVGRKFYLRFEWMLSVTAREQLEYCIGRPFN